MIDWTHPSGREYLLEQVEYILSNRDGCLDCDWLRSNHWRAPDPRYFKFHDPDWGIGDLMSLKAQQLIYAKAKAVKPHCCVSKAALAEPWMQPYADADLLCEDHTPWTDRWYERGNMATRLIRDTIFVTDPWHLSITKANEYYMAMAVWCTNEVPDVSDYLAKAAVFVCPIRMGKGQRGTVLEAMAAGVPVVSTSLAAEGISAQSGHNILLADTPHTMREGICLLLDEPALSTAIAERGRQLATTKYSWPRCVDRLEEALYKVVR